MKKIPLVLFLTLTLFSGFAFSQDDEADNQNSPAIEASSSSSADDNSGEDMKVPPRGQMGRVHITTNPPGSIVYLGGEELGKTPVDKEVPSGRQDLVITDQGQELVNIRFNVWPGKVNEYTTKTVMPFGTIEVTTKPPRCDIYLDGELADGTDGGPLTIHSVDAGDHMVEAVCGRKRAEEMVHVVGEATVELHLDATKKKKRK